LQKDLKTVENTKLKTDSLAHHFKRKPVFKTEDIMAFYRQSEKNIKQTTVNWRIYSLVQKGVIQRIGRGKFTLEGENRFSVDVSSFMKSIFDNLKKEFPFTEICIWNSNVLNEFMLHQPTHFYYLIEVEKESMYSVFYFLRDIEKSVFINPTEDTLEKYAYNENSIVIVKPLVSEAPTQVLDGFNTVTLEKLLVDIYCDNELFSAMQGAELRTIFAEASNKYLINLNKMLRYADRRAKKEMFISFLETIPNFRRH
jgi:hypothetical protein